MKMKYLLAFSIFLLIVTLGAVSANENITEDISQSSDGEVLENAVSGNTFTDIQNAVNSAKANDVIELNGTYTSSGKAIKVNKNLVFDGSSNGSTLDAKKLSGIFTPSSYNYKITLKNLNFINAKDSVFLDDRYNSKGTLIIENCNFTNNSGKEYGAIVCCNCIATNSNFIGNKAAGIYDGTEYVSWAGAIEASEFSLTNCIFEKNSALNEGGAIEGNGNITNCSFKSNSVKYYGGAIYGHVTAVNSNFTLNSATKGDGGAVCCDGVFKNCIFTSNSANDEGGALYGDVVVENCIFKSNTAGYGGAIHASFENVTIINSTFISNSEGAVLARGIVVKNPDKKFKGETVLDNNLSSFNLINANVKSLSTTYHSGKTLKIKCTKTTSGKPASKLGVGITVYRGKKIFDAWEYTDEYLTTNSKGYAYFKASKLPVGTYTITIFEGYLDNDDDFFKCPIPSKTVTVKISKAKTIVKAPKVVAKYKKTKYFKVTVKNKATKKGVKSLKLKVKVYTGKKYKTYTIKTNKKGVAKLNTKKLRYGKHKVVITSKNKNFKVSAKSYIRIKW